MRHCKEVEVQPRWGKVNQQARQRGGPGNSKVADLLGVQGPRGNRGSGWLTGRRQFLELSRLKIPGHQIGQILHTNTEETGKL